MAEWSIAAVLKTVEGHTSGGSNPSLSANDKVNSAVSQRLTAVLILYTYKNRISCKTGQMQNRHMVKKLCLRNKNYTFAV